jgi:hypothetical protein
LSFSPRHRNLELSGPESRMPEQTAKPTTTIAKPDPFKPAQPIIPGVPRAGEKTHGGLSENARTLIVIAGGACGILLVSGLVLMMFARASRRNAAPVLAAPASVTAPADSAPKPDAVPVGPGVIATTEELSKAWSGKRFDFMNPMTHALSQAEVVRLPNGSYWGFLLTEPFGDCRLEYVQDLSRLQDVYGFRAEHPMVGDPCSKAVFDLTKYGAGIEGLVRGDIVQGSGLRPPIAIEIKVQGDKIIAVRSE